MQWGGPLSPKAPRTKERRGNRRNRRRVFFLPDFGISPHAVNPRLR